MVPIEHLSDELELEIGKPIDPYLRQSLVTHSIDYSGLLVMQTLKRSYEVYVEKDNIAAFTQV
ncbi:hypothetical protein HYU11_01855 [Candidatus Woesearchaeota archaeon]|nr:hypothetical protein [Candidatus Woesearchaeota archaeon]